MYETQTLKFKKGDKVFIVPKGTTETITKVNRDGRYETDKSDYTWNYYELRKVIKPKMTGAKKSVPANQTRGKQITKKPVSKHKDLMSHNVRINVLSGLGGKPTPLVLNGVSRVTRGSYYLLQYPDGEVSNKALFKYLKKLKTGELVFDVYQKGKSGAFNKPIQYQFPPSALLSLVKTKKPTAKELSIGHLKLLK